MPSSQQTAAASCLDALDSALFRALSEPSRVDILRTLIARGRSDVGTIASESPRDRSVTTRHLRVLLDAGILRSTREGRHIYYELDGEGVVTQLEQLTSLLRALVPLCCPPSKPVDSALDNGENA